MLLRIIGPWPVTKIQILHVRICEGVPRPVRDTSVRVRDASRTVGYFLALQRFWTHWSESHTPNKMQIELSIATLHCICSIFILGLCLSLGDAAAKCKMSISVLHSPIPCSLCAKHTCQQRNSIPDASGSHHRYQSPLRVYGHKSKCSMRTSLRHRKS